MSDERHQAAIEGLCPHLRALLDVECLAGNPVDHSETRDDGRVLIRMGWQWADPPPKAPPPVRFRRTRGVGSGREFHCTEHHHTLEASTTTRPDRDPPWWTHALELEAQDRLAEAEETVRAAMLPRGLPWPAQLAALYERRLQRLHGQGAPVAQLVEARNKAVHWMDLYASGAISGGEGAALSYEAMQFRKRLGMD